MANEGPDYGANVFPFARSRENRGLNEDSGDGTSGGMTRDWKSSVEQRLGDLHSDVRALLAALIVGFLILAGGGWTIYSNLASQATEQRIAGERAAGLAAERDAVINGKLEVIDSRLSNRK